MRKGLMLSVVIVLALAGYLWAAGEVAIDVGRAASTYKVTLSSVTGTIFYSQSLVSQAKSGVCKAYGANTVFIATNTATTHGAIHWNILNGLPLGASEYFTLGGRFGGTWAGNCDVGVASCEMRCAFGKD